MLLFKETKKLDQHHVRIWNKYTAKWSFGCSGDVASCEQEARRPSRTTLVCFQIHTSRNSDSCVSSIVHCQAITSRMHQPCAHIHLSVAFRALCLHPRRALLKYAFKVRSKKKKPLKRESNIDHAPHDRGDWREDGPQERDRVSSGRDVENAIWWSNFNQAVKRNVFPRQEAPAPWAAAAFHPYDISCASLVKAVGPLVPSSSQVIF